MVKNKDMQFFYGEFENEKKKRTKKNLTFWSEEPAQDQKKASKRDEDFSCHF